MFFPESEISIYVIKSWEKKLMSFKSEVVWRLLTYIIKIKSFFSVWEKNVKLLTMGLLVMNTYLCLILTT